MMSMFKMVVPSNTLAMPLSLVIFRLVFLKQALSLFSFLHLLHTSKSQNISELHSLELSTCSIFHPRTLRLQFDPSTFEILTCPMRLFGKITERNQIKKKKRLARNFNELKIIYVTKPATVVQRICLVHLIS